MIPKSEDDVKPHLTPEGKFALLLILVGFLVFVPFVILGKAALGYGTCICLAMVAIAVRATWALHRRGWYWAVVAISSILQLPIIFYMPWSQRAYRVMLFPLGICDFVLVWGCVKLTEKLFEEV